jgi:Tfp pilus assembly protein PilO
MMSSNRIIRAIFKRDLTTREQIIMFLTLLSITGALVYRFPYLSLTKSVNALAANVAATEQKVSSLSVQIADIKAHEAELKAGLKNGIVGWELVDQRGALLFLDDVSSEARRQGVSLIAVNPSQEMDKETYKEVSMNLDLKGRYRELAEYFRHLENLSRIVSIRKIRIEACPDSSSACATQLEAVTYMSK